MSWQKEFLESKSLTKSLCKKLCSHTAKPIQKIKLRCRDTHHTQLFIPTDEVTAQLQSLTHLHPIHMQQQTAFIVQTLHYCFSTVHHTRLFFCHSSGSLWNLKRNDSETVLTFLAGDFRFRAHCFPGHMKTSDSKLLITRTC